MNKTQEKREQLYRGQQVCVLVNIAPNVPTKRRKARVIEVLRAAAKLQVEGEEKPRLVPFKDIETDADVAAQRPVHVPIRPANPVVELVTRDRRPMETPKLVSQAPVASTAVQRLREERTEVDAWLAMGRELLKPMEERVALLRQEDAALAEEAAAIGEQRKSLAAEIEVISRRIDQVKDAVGES